MTVSRYSICQNLFVAVCDSIEKKPMSFTESSLIIRWTESRSSRFHWFIRGLRPDGSFYGEVRSENESPRESDGATGVGCGIEGRISNDDIKHLTQLVAQIREHPCIDTDKSVVGLLAEGPVSKPVVVYRFCEGAAEKSKASDAFLAIIAILRPYIATHYPKLV